MSRSGERVTPVALFILAALLLPAASVQADHTPVPTAVSIPGSFQSELGCPGDWQPDCLGTHLALDPEDGVWQGTWTIPIGNYEYKAALNDTWDENYGANAVQNGANIFLGMAAPANVKFYYDHETHWITDSRTSVVATAPGSYQSEIGCAGDWDPSCLRAWLQDPDGDGVYTFTTDAIPTGSYEAKVTIDESWNENYGFDGIQNGPNIPFFVPEGLATVTFSYTSATHIMTITVNSTVPTVDATWGGLKGIYR